MHGRKSICLIAFVFSLFLFACEEEDSSPSAVTDLLPVALGQDFQASLCGDIQGQVTWQGEKPAIEAFRQYGRGGLPARFRPNPNTPRIDPATQGIHGAVVFLRDMDPARSRPWDLGAVKVTLSDGQFVIHQNVHETSVGIARRGDILQFTSHDDDYHLVRGRGADFFALPLVDKERSTRRRLNNPGFIELSSGAGHYWMRAHVAVTEHPYFAVTDADGRFRLPQAPSGRHRLACWLPDWQITDKMRDQETAHVIGVEFARAKEKGLKVLVEAGKSIQAHFHWSLADFTRP